MKHLLKSLAALIITISVFTACNQSEQIAPVPEQDQLQDIPTTLENFDVEVGFYASEALPDFDENNFKLDNDNNQRRARRWLFKRPTFFTLLFALKSADLLQTVIVEQLTIFAPTDAAFAQYGIYPWNVHRVPDLDKILLYHAVAGKVKSTDLSEGFVPTLNGAAVEVSFDGGKININQAEVIKADVHALNGIVHVIDDLLFPPTESIVDIVVSNDNFSILKDALIKTGLVDAFTDEIQWTVFAPTNAAFVDLLGELGASGLDDIPNDVLANVLLYHVVDGRVYSSDLSDGLAVAALNGGIITFDLSGAPAIIDENGRVAPLEISALNIQATNGVIHVLNRVILPNLSS